MSAENRATPDRFTLRKEYFGGLVLDSHSPKAEFLNPQEYEFLSRLKEAEGVFFSSVLENNPDLAKRVNAFAQTGFIERGLQGEVILTNIRLVSPPDQIRDGVLTAPIRVYDMYTRRCNLSCEHCYAASNPFIKEDRRTIEQTADIMRKFYDSGAVEWRFTGGEPTVYPDLFDAIDIAQGLGMNVSMNSNGWWSENTAQKIVESGITEMVISIEGEPGTNDLRRKVGSYDHVVDALDRVDHHNRFKPDTRINVIINTAVGRDNVNDAEFVVKLAAKYGHDVNFLPLKPSGRARHGLQSVMLSTREWMEFSRKVQQLREDPEVKASGINLSHRYKDLFCPTAPDRSDKPYPFNYAECGATTTAISMFPDGRVFACPFVIEFDVDNKFVGPNMVTSSVEEAWNHVNIDTFRTAEKTQGCTDCDHLSKGCRGACKATVLGYGGEITEGKLIGEDPYCYVNLMNEEEIMIEKEKGKNRRMLPLIPLGDIKVQ
jgi:radical SAM protein with 4Fe4S-binding SPASM domain